MSEDLLSLKERIALVTGGSRGIGKVSRRVSCPRCRR